MGQSESINRWVKMCVCVHLFIYYTRIFKLQILYIYAHRYTHYIVYIHMYKFYTLPFAWVAPSHLYKLNCGRRFFIHSGKIRKQDKWKFCERSNVNSIWWAHSTKRKSIVWKLLNRWDAENENKLNDILKKISYSSLNN